MKKILLILGLIINIGVYSQTTPFNNLDIRGTIKVSSFTKLNILDSLLAYDPTTGFLKVVSASTIGGGTPGGNDYEIQFNLGGSFTASDKLVYNSAQTVFNFGSNTFTTGTGLYSAIFGGVNNQMNGISFGIDYSVLLGGTNNVMTGGDRNLLGGGDQNTITEAGGGAVSRSVMFGGEFTDFLSNSSANEGMASIASFSGSITNSDESGLYNSRSTDISTSTRAIDIGGNNNTITGLTNFVSIACTSLTPTVSNAVYVPNLYLQNTPPNDDALTQILVYDPVTDQVQYRTAGSIGGGTTIYTGDGALSANRTVTTGSNTLLLKTTTSGGGSTPFRIQNSASTTQFDITDEGEVTIGDAATSYTLPKTRGTIGQTLETDGSGNVSWATGAADGNIYDNNGTISAARTVTMGGGTLQIEPLFIRGSSGAGANRIGLNYQPPNSAGPNVVLKGSLGGTAFRIIDDDDISLFDVLEDGRIFTMTNQCVQGPTTYTFGGGGSGDVASITVQNGLITAVSLVP